MPPPGHEPFLRAICADPADDTVRLVYADWLDENGDPARAEFVRLQVAVPKQPSEFDPRYTRAEELRRLHGSTWRAELPWIGGITYGPFRRGFIDGVTFEHFRVYAQQSADLLSRVPAGDVRLVQVHARAVESLLTDPHAPRLTVLKVNAGSEAGGVIDRLANVGWVWRLRELVVTGWGQNPADPYRARPMITDREAAILARAAVFSYLRILDLKGADLSPKTYAELVARFGKGLSTTPRMSS